LEATPPDVQAMAGAFGDELARAGISAGSLLDDLLLRTTAAAEIGVPLFQRWVALLPR
jgi:hypothetical protein